MYYANVLSDELYITTGASFGVTLISTALFEAGDMAFVADPTYFLVFKMLRTGNLNLTSGMWKLVAVSYNYHSHHLVSADEQGIIPEALEEAVSLQSTKHATRPLTEDKPYRGLVYLIPTFDNPTGRCLSDG